MKRREGWKVVVLLLAVGVMSAGCASPPAQSPVSEGTTTSAGPSEDEQASVELKTHDRHHHAGFVGLLLAAVETVGVTPDQQPGLDKIKADFRVKVEPVRVANAAVMNALADGVSAGNIDSAKVDAAVAGVTAAAAQIHAATAEALNSLHALLRPEQRATLVDKVEAQWSVWKEVNAGDPATERADAHIAHLSKELGLTSDQVDKTRANLAALPTPTRGPFDPSAAEAHMKAFGIAFAGDTFDAKTLSTADPANAKMVGWGAGRVVHFYQALTPVLTSDQRATVAATLREHANEP